MWCARNGRSIMATGMSEMMDIALEPAAEGETATATSNPDAFARLSDAPKTADVGTSEATDDAERDSAPLMRRGAVGGV